MNNASSDQPSIYFFAYGMLTDPKIMPAGKLVGKVKLSGFRIEFPRFANIVADKKSCIWGVLWKINKVTLETLDYYENVPDMYSRISVSIPLYEKEITAQAYTMTAKSRTRFADDFPSDSYIKSLESGYKSAGINLSQLKSLKTHAIDTNSDN